jgi:hypothetical protein
MGIWRFAGAFAVVKRQKRKRAMNRRNARQPANEHRRVLCTWRFVLFDKFTQFSHNSNSLCMYSQIQ